MEKRFSNKLTMYRAVQKVLLKFKNVWQALAALLAASGDLDAYVIDIETMSKQAKQPTNSVTESKNNVRDLLEKVAFRVTSALTAFASRSNNIELKGKVDFEESELTGLTQNQLLDETEKIHALATDNEASLADYGVDADDLAELKTLIDQFRASIPGARNLTGSRMAAGKSMRELFNGADGLLKDQMDRMVEKYRKSNPDFYEEYHISRMTIDYGTRHERKEDATTKGEATK